MDRGLERVYDRIFIDEVQDLCGYDLEVVKFLMLSKTPIEMVGDIRQAILATNQREAKNKKYMYMGIWEWFRAAEKVGHLVIVQRAQTWRCGPQIAELADSIFHESWGFDATESLDGTVTEHDDGVFLLRPEDVEEYVSRSSPLVLRHSAASARNFDHLEPMNFGDSKGHGARVLILPTGAIEAFLQRGKALTESQAARFYVAVTRAQQRCRDRDVGRRPKFAHLLGPNRRRRFWC